MDKALLVYHWFMLHLAPWLVASFIPSLIVGLTPYPKASPVLKVLSALLKALSWATHKDEAGTFQLPVLGMAKKAKMLLVLVLVGSLASCAWLQAHPKTARALDCAKQSVVSTIPALLTDVIAALSGGSPDWAALGSLEALHGADTIGCAVAAAMEQGQEVANPDAGMGMANMHMGARVAKNGAEYLKAKGVK